MSKGGNLKGWQMAVLIVVVFFIAMFCLCFIAFALMSAYNSASEATATIPSPTDATDLSPTPYSAVLVCQDCFEEGILINIWTHPDRSGIAGTLNHKTPIQVNDKMLYDGIWYYKISAQGVEGWVRDFFVEGGH